jgi:BirA family biotin operon repressor/biotin-[acetyl-CoA-carboxylase] ligase
MTRARVSQLLKRAEASGLALERLRGRGYRLIDPTPFLDRAAIVGALGAHAEKLVIDVVDSVDSTNSELLRRAPGRDIHRHLLAAEWQTAGRGRRGRNWTAIAGGSLTFSLGWRFEQGAAHLAGLPLAVGVAMARALEASGYGNIELKWPNDLVHRQGKLGGILIELSGDALGPSLAVIGVGLNVRLSAPARRDIAQPVTDLAAIAGTGDRNARLRGLPRSLFLLLERYAREGFAAFAASGSGGTPCTISRCRCCWPTAALPAAALRSRRRRRALLIERSGVGYAWSPAKYRCGVCGDDSGTRLRPQPTRVGTGGRAWLGGAGAVANREIGTLALRDWQNLPDRSVSSASMWRARRRAYASRPSSSAGERCRSG